ncbi:MAG TPA: S9 family peptidase [Thermomicrobiales bacterium]|nr:S9 family peptidase [Thermomicrobiales bacterium]
MAITARDLYALKFVGDPRVSPDGARVAFVVTTMDEERDDYRSRIWLAPADGSAPPRPLTAGDRKDTAPRWSPDGRRLVFVSSREPRVRPAGLDEDEEAKPQLWLLDLAGGEARQLTALKEGAGDPAWSPDGRFVVCTSRTGGEGDGDEEPAGGKRPRTKEERARAKANRVRVIGTLKYKFDGQGFFDGKRRHLFVVEVDGPDGAAPPAPRQLTDGDWHDGAPAWSPDGRTIACTSYREPDEDVTFRSDIFVVPAAGGETRKLTASRGSSAAPAWSPDGRTIAYLGHVEGEGAAATTRLWTVDADGGEPVCLTADFDRDLGNSTLTDQTLPAGAAGPAWTPDGAALLALVSDGGACGLRRFPVAGGPPATLVGGERVVTAFSASADGARLVFAATDPTAPAEICACDGAGHDERPLTVLNRDFLASREIARPERLRFAGHGGDPIDGWLLRPPETPGAPAPLIVELHGGPHAQYGAAFFHEFQVLAGRGYAVFYCNPHGSTGYGERFAKELLRAWGEKAMPDVMAGVDAALARGGLDGDRMGVTGGSYGGYLTNWIVTQTDRFRAAVTQRSYCNSLAVFGVDDIGAISDVAELGGHPWELPDLYLRLSPIMYVANVTTPVLIEHQELDYRCPISQAEQWFAALKKRGVPTQFIRYPNESHGMSRDGQPKHRLARLDHNLAWFDRWLKEPDHEGGADDPGDE